MKLSAIKKADGKIWLAHGDASRAMEAGDTLIELPSDWVQPNPKYCDCWAEASGEIVIDLAKAKTQKSEEVRQERNRRLTETDAEWVKLSSMGTNLAAITTKKQALRDVPETCQSAIDACTSTEALEAYQPTWP